MSIKKNTFIEKILKTHLIKTIVFILILLMLYNKMSMLIMCCGTDYNNRDRLNRLFFELPRKTVDVLICGNSRAMVAFDSKRIFDSSGITSASLATSNQSFQNTYWLLREAYLRQSPKVVVLEISPLLHDINDINTEKLYYTSGISCIPDISYNKICAFFDIRNNDTEYTRNMRFYDAYSFFQFRNDSNRKYTLDNTLKLLLVPQYIYAEEGFGSNCNNYYITEFEEDYMNELYTINNSINENVDYLYLKKIIKLTKKNNSDIILVRTPVCVEEESYNLNFYALIKDEEIPFMDYETISEDIGISPDSSFLDGVHLNGYGARIVTDHLCYYLAESDYGLKNHKGERKYSLWSITKSIENEERLRAK